MTGEEIYRIIAKDLNEFVEKETEKAVEAFCEKELKDALAIAKAEKVRTIESILMSAIWIASTKKQEPVKKRENVL